MSRMTTQYQNPALDWFQDPPKPYDDGSEESPAELIQSSDEPLPKTQPTRASRVVD